MKFASGTLETELCESIAIIWHSKSTTVCIRYNSPDGQYHAIKWPPVSFGKSKLPTLTRNKSDCSRSDLSIEDLLKQTDDNLGKGFRAIKMKVGRPDLASDVARVRAMRDHLGGGFP